MSTSENTQNRLLAALPRDEYDQLLSRSELIRFRKNRILYEAGEAIQYAYFPNNGMASLLAITEDGSTIEIGTVGREGYIGGPILHQLCITPYRLTVQMPMMAFRMEANAFLIESHREGSLRQLLL